MKHKMFALVSILMAATMFLAACGGGVTTVPTPTQAVIAPPPVSSDIPVTITIWHQWSGDYLTAIQAVFTQYMTDHPNVTIDLSKPDDVTAALAVAIPAGQGPDIIAWANDAIGTNALNGNIVALDNYGVNMAFLQSTYEPAGVAGVVWQNKIWALPESQEGIALVYNKDIVPAQYLPTDPTNFQDLLDKAKAFYEAYNMPLFCNQGFKGGDAYHIAPVFFGFGVKQYVDDQGNVTVNTPEAIAAMEWLKKIQPYMFQDANDEACRTAMKEGKVGAQWGGPWLISDFENAGINYGILPMGSPFVGIKTVMLTANAVSRGHEGTALDIMKYYTGFDAQKAVTLANKTVTANTQALNDPEVQALSTIAGFGAALNLGRPMANTPYAGAQWGPVGDAVGAIWNGSQTPAEALAAAQTAIEAAVAGMK
jgi:arabinogalactan oligomer/maltooligosaccharide transport system substrate-binding protein